MNPTDPSRAPAPIRYGMVGGGEGAFIGAVHRMAARLDGEFTLVAGALSSTADKARRSGLALGLAEDRIYGDYATMARAESARADGIQAVVIVTPNHVHGAVARAFLEAGIHVICDKPVTTTSEEAQALLQLATAKDRLFAVTHNYSANAMVRQARQMVREGALGELRFVQVEYLQGWLAEPIEQQGQKQAAWRTDPAQAGGGAIGDIGSHAWQLADFVCGQPLRELCAELVACVPGRVIDDHVQVLLRYDGGLRGTLTASQVAIGHANDLRLRVYGSQGALEWRQEDAEHLRHTPLGQPTRIITRAGPGTTTAADQVTRIPAGHPEGYLEAFATLYREIAHAIRTHPSGASAPDFPTLLDGLRGVQFIETVQRSAREGGRWVTVPRTSF